MKVKDLIKELKKHDENADIVLNDSSPYEIGYVYAEDVCRVIDYKYPRNDNCVLIKE